MPLGAKETMFPKLFSPTVGACVQLTTTPFPPKLPKFGNAQPLARTSDPATSKAAAKVLTRSGQRDSSKAKVLAQLRQAGTALTSAELASRSGIPHPTVHKRLPDLRRDGLVGNGPARKCGITGRQSLTWR